MKGNHKTIEITLDYKRYNIVELLRIIGAVKSNGEARRLIKQGGVRIFDIKDIVFNFSEETKADGLGKHDIPERMKQFHYDYIPITDIEEEVLPLDTVHLKKGITLYKISFKQSWLKRLFI